MLIYDTDDGRMGSQCCTVLGPMLSNVMYDGVLRLKLSKGSRITAFSDDIVLVIRGKHLDELAVGMVRSCLAHRKTDVLFISSTKKYRSGKCAVTLYALARIMRNPKGLKQERRRQERSIIDCVQMYFNDFTNIVL